MRYRTSLLALAFAALALSLTPGAFAYQCLNSDNTCDPLNSFCLDCCEDESPSAFGTCGNAFGGGFETPFDAHFNCVPVSVTTSLNLGVSSSSYFYAGDMFCTFTDDGAISGNVLNESALCTANIQYGNLTPVCDDTANTVSVTGACPSSSTSNPITVSGSIDCTGGGAGGINPSFCTYDHNDANGYPGGATGTCQWNVGIARQNGNPLSGTQCETAFGSPPTVLSYSETHSSVSCPTSSDPTAWVLGSLTSFATTTMDACHSETFDPAADAYCSFTGGVAHQTTSGDVLQGLIVDIAIPQPGSLNASCNNDAGSLTLTIYSIPQDPNAGANTVDVTAIPDSTITLNGRSPSAPCTVGLVDGVQAKQCTIATCAGGASIVNNIQSDGTTILTLNAQTTTGNPVTGSERKAISSNADAVISITNLSGNEGDTGTQSFNFSLTMTPAVTTGSVVVDYHTSDGSATVADSDYQAVTSSSVTFLAGETSKTITVLVNGDDAVEGDETFNVHLSIGSTPGGTGVAFAQSVAVGTIVTDDTVTVSIDDVGLSEGTGTAPTPFDFTVTLDSTGTLGSLNVDFATADGPSGEATAPADYAATSGTLPFSSIMPGITTGTITVNVVADSFRSSPRDERFFVNLMGTMPPGVSISDDQGLGTIENDDGGPSGSD